jgi:Ser/Thr protein kinase RdoA (MazF antagonist)
MPESEPEQVKCTTERLRLFNYLASNGVSVVYPHHSTKGNLWEQIESGDMVYIAYIMNKASGQHVKTQKPDQWNETFFTRWGNVIGEFHAWARKYPNWQGSLEEELKKEKESFHLPLLGWQQEWEFFDSVCQDDAVREKWRELKRRLEQLPVRRNCFGFVHNDPHPGNLLIDGERVTLLDFDVSRCGWFITDIAIAVHGALWANEGAYEESRTDGDFAPRFLDAFMAGYEGANHLNRTWFGHLETFLSYRRILLFIVSYEALRQNVDHFTAWRESIINDAPIFSRGKIL